MTPSPGIKPPTTYGDCVCLPTGDQPGVIPSNLGMSKRGCCGQSGGCRLQTAKLLPGIRQLEELESFEEAEHRECMRGSGWRARAAKTNARNSPSYSLSQAQSSRLQAAFLAASARILSMRSARSRGLPCLLTLSTTGALRIAFAPMKACEPAVVPIPRCCAVTILS